jgi:predicted alpha/beta-fold hydrolase
MPIVHKTNYSPHRLFSNGHAQTIFPALFRRVGEIEYRRQRIFTPDGDFLDLDWSCVGSNRLAILSHGLEGNSRRPYIVGMARVLNRNNWDVLAWNFRGCSGEANRTFRFYHSGATEDLHAVISCAETCGEYHQIALIGFSMGGNMTLKYLGERSLGPRSLIKKAVAISVPCDLLSGAIKMAAPVNAIYMIRFLRSLHRKIELKTRIMPGRISTSGYSSIKTFKQFDDRYTAPLHGFKSAEDYYRKASCRQFLRDIEIPTLLVNAQDDPFLDRPCYPIEEANDNPHLFLEMPKFGGHVGFMEFNPLGEYWSERRALDFLDDQLRSEDERKESGI